MRTTSPERQTLSDLPLAARLLLSAFLLSVGIGYFSALVQLHFQHARAGDPLPRPEDVEAVYHGNAGVTELERILTTDETRPFASGGTMKPAFFSRSAGWKNQIRKRATSKKISPVEAEKELRREHEVELNALVDWVRAGAQEATFTAFPISGDVVKAAYGGEEPNSEFFESADGGKWVAKIGNIINTRCARCHAEGKGGSAGHIHLETWQDVHTYCEPGHGSALSLTKLAQSTHVHLLGFSMLYGMTGLIFAFSSYPGLIRGVLAPLPLVAQVVDISCWWLARTDPMFARTIIVTGGIVAMGLALQIVLSLFNMYRLPGKALVLLLLLGGGVGAWQLHERVVQPHLEQERAGTISR